MKYCPHCGAPTTGTPFCGNCGKRIETPTEGSERSAGADQATPASPGVGSQTSLLPKPSLFSDITVSDYLRDVVALVLLLISFGMPWNFGGDVTSAVYVILATLLSIVSLSLPYLSRAGVFPPAFGTDRLRLARLLANVPYVVIVIIAIVLDFVEVSDGGIGVGAMFGLAGVVLAAQPRTAEHAPSDSALWRTATLGIGGVIVVCSTVAVLLDLVDTGDASWEATTTLILIIALYLVVGVLPVYGFYNRDSSSRDVMVVVGAAAIVAGFWLMSSSVDGVWPVRVVGPVIVFWPALAAAVTAVGMGAYVDVPAGAQRWVRDVVRVCELTVIVAAFGIALTAVDLSATDVDRGAKITLIVLYLIVVAAALVGRGAIGRDPVQGRSVALTVAGVVIVLGIVLAAVAPSVDFLEIGILSMLFVFPAAIGVMLTVPQVVRDELAVMSGSVVRGSGGSQVPGSGATTSAAETEGSSDGQGSHNGYTSDVAADPATPLEVLADIAAKEPSLRPYIAANPSTYPELLQWLSNLGDPAVDEALRGRDT